MRHAIPKILKSGLMLAAFMLVAAGVMMWGGYGNGVEAAEATLSITAQSGSGWKTDLAVSRYTDNNTSERATQMNDNSATLTLTKSTYTGTIGNITIDVWANKLNAATASLALTLGGHTTTHAITNNGNYVSGYAKYTFQNTSWNSLTAAQLNASSLAIAGTKSAGNQTHIYISEVDIRVDTDAPTPTPTPTSTPTPAPGDSPSSWTGNIDTSGFQSNWGGRRIDGGIAATAEYGVAVNWYNGTFPDNWALVKYGYDGTQDHFAYGNSVPNRGIAMRGVYMYGLNSSGVLVAYAADVSNTRIPSQDINTGNSNLRSVDFDPQGNLWAFDRSTKTVKKYTISGTTATQVSSWGNISGASDHSTVTSNGGNVWVFVGGTALGYTAAGLRDSAQDITTANCTNTDRTGISVQGAYMYYACSRTIYRTTLPNLPPTVTVTASATSVRGGGTISLTSTVSDPDGDTITSYAWSALPAGGTFSAPTSANSDWKAPAVNTPQTATITLSATDSGGATGTGSVSVLLNVNAAPEVSVEIVTGYKSTLASAQSTMVRATATDTDTPLTYAWSDSISIENGVFGQPAAAQTSWLAPYVVSLTSGQLTVTVTDSIGASASASVNINVVPSTPPVVSFTTSHSSVVSGGSILLTGTATNPDGGTLTYSWSSSNGGTFSAPSALVTNWTAPHPTSALDSTITLTASNVLGVSASATKTVAITGNHAPVIHSTQPSTAFNIASGGSINLSVTATDPDNDPLTYTWSAAIPGATALPGHFTFTNRALTNWTAPNVLGEHTVRITIVVSDGLLTASANIEGTIGAQVTGPRVVVTTPTDIVGNGATLSVSGFVSDPDGDSYTLAWTAQAGSFADSTALNTTWTAPTPAARTFYRVTLTATDTNNLSGSDYADILVLEPGAIAPTPVPTATPAFVYFRVPLDQAFSIDDNFTPGPNCADDPCTYSPKATLDFRPVACSNFAACMSDGDDGTAAGLQQRARMSSAVVGTGNKLTTTTITGQSVAFYFGSRVDPIVEFDITMKPPNPGDSLLLMELTEAKFTHVYSSDNVKQGSFRGTALQTIRKAASSDVTRFTAPVQSNIPNESTPPAAMQGTEEYSLGAIFAPTLGSLSWASGATLSDPLTLTWTLEITYYTSNGAESAADLALYEIDTRFLCEGCRLFSPYDVDPVDNSFVPTPVPGTDTGGPGATGVPDNAVDGVPEGLGADLPRIVMDMAGLPPKVGFAILAAIGTILILATVTMFAGLPIGWALSTAFLALVSVATQGQLVGASVTALYMLVGIAVVLSRQRQAV